MKKEFLISTIISSVACVIAIVAIIFALIPNNGIDGKDGKDGITPTIEISDDGYWVINGEKTDVSAVAKPKEFVVGEEVLLNDGKEFSIPIANTNEWCTGVTAKLVAVEEIPLDSPEAWVDKDGYSHSYKYRLYVSGYGPVKNAGKECTYTLAFRLSPITGAVYVPRTGYKTTTIGEDGYFEFSIDFYSPDVVTKVIPVRMYG